MELDTTKWSGEGEFTQLLIETTKDFTLRQVPRGRQYGVVEKKVRVLCG